MSGATFATMIFFLAFYWGGTLYFMYKAAKSEERKK